MEHLTADGSIEPYPYQGYLLAPILAAARAQGRTDVVALWAGQASPLIAHRHAGELYAALVRGTEDLLASPTTPEGATDDHRRSSLHGHLHRRSRPLVVPGPAAPHGRRNLPDRLRGRPGTAGDHRRRPAPHRPRPCRVDHDQAAGGVPGARRRWRGLLRRRPAPAHRLCLDAARPHRGRRRRARRAC